MGIPLIVLLLAICLAVMIVVRNVTKTAHVTEDAFTLAGSPLTLHEYALLAALERSLPDTFRIFAKLRLSDIVVPSEKLSPKEQHAARRHADQFPLTFVLCAHPEMKVIAVVVCEERPGTGGDSVYVHKVLAANGIPVISFKAKTEYYQLEVWVKLSEACPGLFEQPPAHTQKVAKPSLPLDRIARATPETPETLETTPPQTDAESQPAPSHAALPVSQQTDSLPCPVCSGTMIRRQVMKGPHTGKFFRVCSNFPTCRQMVALPDAAESSAPAEQPLTSSASAAAKTASTPSADATPSGASPVVVVYASAPADEPSAPPPADTSVRQITTTKPILLTAAVTAQPVSAMPSAVPTVEPQHDQTCTKCGKNMIKMQVAKGAHAGKFFWACSGYPACRHMAAIKD